MTHKRNLPLEIELCLPNELGYEKVAMASAASAARKVGFSEEKVEDIKTALAEACTNAIEHGNKFDIQSNVRVKLTVAQKQVQLKVIDEGQEPIPAEVPDRTLRPDFRGMGLFLIKNLMDKVEVKSQPGRNEIRMTSTNST